jgi:hypothetical protein
MKARGQAHNSGNAVDRQRLSVLLDVALVVYFDADWHEALAALTATTAKDVTTVFGLHTGAETELTLPGALRGLIGSFGHNLVWGGGRAV